MTYVRQHVAALGAAVLAGSFLVGCSSEPEPVVEDDEVTSLTVGTTEPIVSIDPAGSRDSGSMTVQTQVYQYLLTFPADATTPQPDAATECAFAQPTEFVCTMRPGLTFENGNQLTASDVAFSFTRVKEIDDGQGPAALLSTMESVEAIDDTTVVFTLTRPNDQTFVQVLTSPAGAIVDEQTYAADRVLDDDEAVEAQGFSGPFTLGEYVQGETAEFTARETYAGGIGRARTDVITLEQLADSAALSEAVRKGDVDVAWRSLSSDDVTALEEADGVTVHTGDVGELRFLVFNADSMPGGNAEQTLAIRKAVATSIDREEIAAEVYGQTFAPAYSAVPQGQPAAKESFKELYGDQPDAAAAEQLLDDAGVRTPVELTLHYSPELYGATSTDELTLLAEQLAADDLFEVELLPVPRDTYSAARTDEAYPFFQLVRVPDFPDPDNYLTPLFGEGNVLRTTEPDETLTAMLDAARTDADPDEREVLLQQVQDRVADQVPILPLITRRQIAVAGDDVEGVAETLDSALRFRFSSLQR